MKTITKNRMIDYLNFTFPREMCIGEVGVKLREQIKELCKDPDLPFEHYDECTQIACLSEALVYYVDSDSFFEPDCNCDTDHQTYNDKPTYKQFVKDMHGAGLAVQDYQGRFYYNGPAVACADIQVVLKGTKVKCQWDNLGLDWIVYPK